MDAVLKMLRQHISFPQLVTAQTIVQGHRELTLSLLWSIIFHFKVDTVPCTHVVGFLREDIYCVVVVQHILET